MSGPRAVLATDLDGTLLRSDGTLSARSREAIAAADAAGVATVFVTGRPPRLLDHLADAVGPHGTAICGNGAFVYDVPRRDVTEVRGFEEAALRDLVERLRAHVPGILLATESARGMARENGFVARTEAEQNVADFGSRVLHPVGKLLARTPELSSEQFLSLVVEVAGDRAELGFSGISGLAELTAPGVTKASALAAWAAERGHGPAGVWACGDMPNDLPMLTWAGRSFAVAAAHPDVVPVVDEVVGSNDDDAVALVLERLTALVLERD